MKKSKVVVRLRDFRVTTVSIDRFDTEFVIYAENANHDRLEVARVSEALVGESHTAGTLVRAASWVPVAGVEVSCPLCLHVGHCGKDCSLR